MVVYALGEANSSRIVGLTGGIGTGKSTVARYLAEAYQLPVLEADRYAREGVAAGSGGLMSIVQRYGTSMLHADGSLNRAQLADLIFTDPQERRWVEGLLHPFVRDRLVQDQQSLGVVPLVVMDIPLLFEADMTDLVSEIWVVSCRPEQQLQRLMQRNGLTEAEAQLRIQSQIPLPEKCARADVVLDNSGSLAALYTQVDRVLGAV